MINCVSNKINITYEEGTVPQDNWPNFSDIHLDISDEEYHCTNTQT